MQLETTRCCCEKPMMLRRSAGVVMPLTMMCVGDCKKWYDIGKTSAKRFLNPANKRKLKELLKGVKRGM